MASPSSRNGHPLPADRGPSNQSLLTSSEGWSLELPLSPRECEIARLVARDLPNKAIAGVLEISEWTVAAHIRRIFGKLGVHSKAAMVARVLDEVAAVRLGALRRETMMPERARRGSLVAHRALSRPSNRTSRRGWEWSAEVLEGGKAESPTGRNFEEER